MRYEWLLLLAMMISLSCVFPSGDKPASDTPTQRPAARTPADDASAWSEDSEEDMAVDDAIFQGLMEVARALKVGSVRAQAQKSPLCLVFTRDAHNNCEIALYEMLSPPGTEPIQTGKELEHYRLPGGVSFAEEKRYFWYDAEGNIDFREPDKILNTFDNPPQGDIVVFPVGPDNPRRGAIDIFKKKTGLNYHQFIIQSNRS